MIKVYIGMSCSQNEWAMHRENNGVLAPGTMEEAATPSYVGIWHNEGEAFSNCQRELVASELDLYRESGTGMLLDSIADSEIFDAGGGLKPSVGWTWPVWTQGSTKGAKPRGVSSLVDDAGNVYGVVVVEEARLDPFF